MSNFTSQSSLLNLAPKAEIKGVQLASSQAYEGDESASFLASLVQALDESTGILPDSLQIAEKEIMQEFMQTQNNLLGGFSEEQKTLIFDSLSFMEVLGVLENLQINASDVKLSTLSAQTQNFVQTQSNLDALKGAKNLNELLQIAKNLGLEVSNVKIEQIFELESTFPNLNKANFFSADNKADNKSVVKEFLNTKIASVLKESENKFGAKHATHKSQSPTNLLSKALQTLANDDEGDILLKNELKNAVQKSLESLAKSEEIALKSEKPTPQTNKEGEKVLSVSEKASKIQANNEKQEVLSTELKANATKEKPMATTERPKEQSFKEILKSVVPNNETQKETKATQSTQTPLNASNAEQTNAQNKVLSSVASSANSNENVATLKKELKKDEKESKINSKEAQKEPKNAGEKLSVKIDEKPLVKNEKSVEEKSAPKQNEPKAELSAKSEPNTTAPKAKEPNLSAQNKISPSQESANKEFKVEFALKDSTATLPNTENKTNANNTSVENALNKMQNKFNDLNANANSSGNENLSQNKEFEGSQSIELDSNFSVGDDNSELNSLIKDLSQVSRSELKSELNVKETFTRFAQDFKEQMQNYKSPITRFNITLNPSNLGEVEVTLIQRGSNLHINFNSTTSTMNLFIQNQAEFKNSLVNMGFTGLEMNFSDQSKKDRQQQGKNRSGYGFKDEFNANENNSGLEVILARYF